MQAAGAAAEPTVQLQIVGGLGGVTQYVGIEQPFWQSEIEKRTGGRISATIRPLDGAGLPSQDMLQLMRLGVVSFGTALTAVAAGDEPELNAIDLPALSPDIATLRKTVGAFRDHLREILLARYDIELLGIYTYPAQVLFCTKPFAGLGDLGGRRVRTSSVAQSDVMTALGAVPVILPFAKTAEALRGGVADCAVTGTLSGYEIGLSGIASHVHAMALSWGLSIFGANAAHWAKLPDDVQKLLRENVAMLEQRIWRQAEADTERGLSCAVNPAGCGAASKAPMSLVATSQADTARRRLLLAEVVLRRWVERCGAACAEAWNDHLAGVHGIKVPAP